MSRNPRTDAGRTLLGIGWRSYEHFRESILAIEDEAAATERRLTVERGRKLLTDALEEWFGPASDGMSAATRRAIVDDTFKIDEEAGNGR